MRSYEKSVRPKAFTLLEVSISLVLLLIIIGEIFWIFRWSSIQMKLSEQTVLAYSLAVREMEKQSMYTAANVARTRASTDSAEPLYNYEVQTNVSAPLWDHAEFTNNVLFPEDGFINPPPTGEYNATYSGASTFVKVTVYWRDYLGKDHQLSVGTVKSRY